MPVLYQY